jgi:hypothetical protein
MESPNLYVKSAKAQKCKSAVFRQSQTCEIRRLKIIRLKNMQNNCWKVCSFHEKSVPLQHSCKIDIRQQNLRHSQREKFFLVHKIVFHSHTAKTTTKE